MTTKTFQIKLEVTLTDIDDAEATPDQVFRVKDLDSGDVAELFVLARPDFLNATLFEDSDIRAKVTDIEADPWQEFRGRMINPYQPASVPA